MNLLKNIPEASADYLQLSWDSLALSEPLRNAIDKEFKFAQMTPVQSTTIPLMLANKDVIVEAKTGSGKTLAFLIPIVEMLIRAHSNSTTSYDSHKVLVIILSPTRELATQIHQELRKILRNNLLPDNHSFVSQLIVGGPSVTSNIDKFIKYGGNIIVATPGRLSAILEMQDNQLSKRIRSDLMYLIFDEADQLLSFGFEKNLSSILRYLPKQRRTSLFSATQTDEVEELIKAGLRNPIRVNLNQLDKSKSKKKRRSDDTNENASKRLPMPGNLTNYYFICDSYKDKLATLAAVVSRDNYKKVLVFLSTCAQIDYFAFCLEKELSDKNLKLLKLHRRLKNKRKAIFKDFKASKRCILLSTDILSRGIDVTDIALVVHVDLPASPECYVHRSGRSGHQIELNGYSLLLLEQFEIDYIEMCRRREIQMEQMNLSHLTNDIKMIGAKLIDYMQLRAAKDEPYKTMGIQAFVSYIRFYSSKLCLRQMLFPKLPIAKLARGFGLIKLPKMPELKKNHKTIELEFESAGNNKLLPVIED